MGSWFVNSLQRQHFWYLSIASEWYLGVDSNGIGVGRFLSSALKLPVSWKCSAGQAAAVKTKNCQGFGSVTLYQDQERERRNLVYGRRKNGQEGLGCAGGRGCQFLLELRARLTGLWTLVDKVLSLWSEKRRHMSGEDNWGQDNPVTNLNYKRGSASIILR